jgi:hypothetical protein
MEKSPTILTAIQYGYTGGFDYRADASDLDQKTSPLIYNGVARRDGWVARRPAFLQFADVHASTAIRKIVWFPDEVLSTAYWLVWAGEHLFTVAADGTVSASRKDGIATAGVIAGCMYANAYYWSDGTNGLWKLWYTQVAVAATLVSDMTAATAADLTFTAKTAGSGGNDISIQFVDPSAVSQSLTITNPSTDHFVISLATDGAGTITSVANDIKTAVDADVTMTAHVAVAVQGAGTGLANALAAAHLAGGLSVGDVQTASVTASYSFSYLASAKGGDRIFGIDAADKTNVRWCDTLTPATWGGTSVLSPGGVFTAIAECGDYVLLAQEEQLLRIDGTVPATWQVRAIPSEDIGVSCPDTLEIREGVPVYQSLKGTAYFDGSRPRVLSDRVNGLLPLNLTSSFAVQIAFNGDQELYAIWFQGDSVQKFMLYDYRANVYVGYWEASFGDALTCAARRSDDATEAGCLFGSNGGKLYKLDYDGAEDPTDEGGGHHHHTISAFVDTKLFDDERPTFDKILKTQELQVANDGAAAADVILNINTERHALGSTSDMTGNGASRTISVAASTAEAVLTDRIDGVRARCYSQRAVWTSGGIRVRSAAIDHFFVHRRS